MVEVGLAAVFFAVPSSVLAGAMGPYDEPKAWALVALVGLTGLAWLAGRVLGGALGPPLEPDRALRIVRWTLVAYGAWWGLATALSVAPGQSLWGGFGRGFGLVTCLAALCLFGIVQAEVRTLDRACRLVDLALIGSVPVVLLALGQAGGWDPLPRGWDPATAELRVRSTFGQHIFLGSYLVVLIPLGIGRALAARGQRERISGIRVAVAALWVLGIVGVLGWGRHGWLTWSVSLVWSAAGAAAWTMTPARSRVEVRLAPQWRVALLGTLVTAQALVLVLSAARGALLGLLAGFAAAAAILLAGRKSWRALAVLGSGVVVIVGVVGVLNLGPSPLDPLRAVPLFQRLGSIGGLRAGSPAWVRLRLWQGVASRWPRQLQGEEIVPGLRPGIRALVGFGPETQLLVLDRFLPVELRSLFAKQDDWRARYTFDRAHNEPLDHLVTAGMIGMLLWFGVLGGIILTGVMRVRAARGTIDERIRLACLAAVLGQAVEGLVGIASPTPRLLFWVAAGILTLPSPLPAVPAPAVSRPRAPAIFRRRLALPSLALLAGACVLVLAVIVGNSRWFLGSMAYAAGIRRGLEGDLPGARRDFLRAVHLTPSAPFPAEAAADVSLRLTVLEADLLRHADWLREAHEALDRARRHVPVRSELWRLSAHVAIARARAGESSHLDEALRHFAEAARLRPGDPEILTQWAVATLRSGDVPGAKRLAEEALATNRRTWLAWTVLANVYDQLGDSARSLRSAQEARRAAPHAAREHIDKILPQP